MFKFNKIEVENIQILEAIVPCQVEVNCYFNANEEKNLPSIPILIDFVHTISEGTKIIEKFIIAGRREAIINTEQNKDYFWRNVKDAIYLEITCGYFSAFPQEEKNAVIEEILKGIKDTVKTLGIEL